MKLLRRAKNLATCHLQLRALFVKEGKLGVLPGAVQHRINAATTLGEPQVTEPVHIAVVEVEDGVPRRWVHRAQPPSHQPGTTIVGTTSERAAAAGDVVLG